MRLWRWRPLLSSLGVGALGVLAACGPGGGAATSTSTEQIVNGGTLTAATWEAQTSFLNAGIVDSQTLSYAINAPVVEGLLWYRPLNETQSAKSLADYWRPDLATEVPTTQNGDVKTHGCANPQAKMCVTWKLRDGVTWHDASKFTSHDVCDTFQFWWLKYGSNNPTAVLSTSGWDQVIGCHEDSPLQATVDWKSQYGPYLSIGTGVYGILPASLLDKVFAGTLPVADATKSKNDIENAKFTVDLSKGSGNPAAFVGTDTMDNFIDGTGPYVLSSFDKNNGVTLVRNKHYWDKAHQPHLDKLIFKFVSAADEMEREAKAGEIDFGLDYRLPPLKDLEDYSKSTGKLNVEVIPDPGAEKIDINTCSADPPGTCGPHARITPALGDKAFRHAMAEAINRPTILQTLALGQSTIPADSFLYLGAEYIRNPNVKTTQYDPQKAAADLDAAGYRKSPSCGGGQFRADKNGACINLQLTTTRGNAVRQKEIDQIRQDLEAVGIQVTEASPLPKAGELFGAYSDGGLLYTHNFDLAVYTNTLSAPAEPDGFWPGYHSSQIPSDKNNGQGQNDTGIALPALDKELDAARSSIDLASRAQHYKAAEVLLADYLPEIPLFQQITVNSINSRVHDVQRNDVVWTFNSYDWWCTAGNCSG